MVIDDGSTDGTVQLVSEWAARTTSIRLLRNQVNRGKGFSVRHGMLEARGKVALFTDADLSSPIQESEKLLDGTRAGNDVAIGSRAIDRTLIFGHQSRFREVAGMIFNGFVHLFTGYPFKIRSAGSKLSCATDAELYSSSKR